MNQHQFSPLPVGETSAPTDPLTFVERTMNRHQFFPRERKKLDVPFFPLQEVIPSGSRAMESMIKSVLFLFIAILGFSSPCDAGFTLSLYDSDGTAIFSVSSSGGTTVAAEEATFAGIVLDSSNNITSAYVEFLTVTPPTSPDFSQTISQDGIQGLGTTMIYDVINYVFYVNGSLQAAGVANISYNSSMPPPTPPIPPSNVPEPSSLVLISIGALSLVGFTRYRRRTQKVLRTP